MNRLPFSPKRVIGFGGRQDFQRQLLKMELPLNDISAHWGENKNAKGRDQTFLKKELSLVMHLDNTTTKNNPQTVISFAYLDFDLYEPTKQALALILIH